LSEPAHSHRPGAELQDAQRRVGRSWGEIQPERWRAVLDLDADATILDVGCSRGRYVDRLRALGRTAWGTDLLLDQTWKPGLFFQGSALTLPLATDAVDCILAFEILEHLRDPVACVRELGRVARRKLVLSVPNCDVPAAMRASGVTFHHWVDETHVNFFTRKSLADMLSRAGLTVDEMRLINPIRPELLFLSTWRAPSRVAGTLAGWLERMPWRRKCHMTILATATVGSARRLGPR